MSQGNKLKPMSSAAFRLMTWTFILNDHFLHIGKSPESHLKDVPIKKGMTVVDYACGPGRYTIPVAEAVGPEGIVYAVDIQPLAMESVKTKALNKSLTNIKAVLVSSYHTGIPDSSADIVLLIDAIQGIKESSALFQEIHRLLKADGQLFMDSGHMKTSEVKNIVERTGLFTMVKLDGKNMLLGKK